MVSGGEETVTAAKGGWGFKVAESQNSFVWKRIFKDYLVQISCSEQGHVPLHHIALSPFTPDPECLGWCIHHFSGQPVTFLLSSL